MDLIEVEDIKERWQEYTKELWLMTQINRARHAEVQSQVALRKHHYEQS